MQSKAIQALFIILAALSICCGSKKPKTDSGDKKDSSAQGEKGSKEQVQAKSRIEQWLGEEASKKVSASAGVLAKDIGETAAKNPSVQKSISKLVNSLFGDSGVKKRTDKIADKATSGLGNKLKLLGKAIAAGGVSSYKKKVKEKTIKAANKVIEAHIRNKILKDPRLSKVIKHFVPVLSLQGRLAAATLQSNLSPKVAQKIFGISLTLSVEGKSDETSKKVESWISQCDGHVEKQFDLLFKEIGKLPSLDKAVEALAIEILQHPTTKKELALMATTILDDKEANKAAIKAYENAAFDKGDAKIEASIQALIDLPIVSTELFKAMERLEKAPGAGGLIKKHLPNVSEDPAMATLIDNFFINLLVTCGDIPI